MPLSALSSAEKLDFAKSGWLLLRQKFGSAVSQRMRENLFAMIADPDCYPNSMFFFEDRGQGTKELNRIERIWEDITVLHEDGLANFMVQTATQCLGQEVVLFKDKLNIRYSGSRGYAAHQDSAAGWDRFSPRFVSFGLFLGPSDYTRGGFEVVSGQHDRGRLPNENGKMSGELFESLSPVRLAADLGDVLILDSEAPHRTANNVSNESIFHLLFTFAPATVGAHVRDNYYLEKERSFAGSRNANKYDFRVFAF